MNNSQERTFYQHNPFDLFTKNMKLRLLQREEIEAPKWNGCIYYSANSKIYGYTWYLDNVAENWMGIVEGDYQSVFPLVWNDRLFGVKQLYQPYLCQQLGLFTVNVRSKERLRQFLEFIPEEFKYWDLALNDGNESILKLSGYDTLQKPNYQLFLDKPYEELAKAYSGNTKRNLKKAQKTPLYLTNSMKPETFIEALQEAQNAKGVKHPDALYHAGLRIIWNCLHRGKGVLTAAYDAETRELCAAIFFMFEGAALINLLNLSTARGKKINAMTYLLDATIQRDAGSTKYIDFEGSSIPGIARFYEGFGAQNTPYYQLINNQLPWWLRWRKRS